MHYNRKKFEIRLWASFFIWRKPRRIKGLPPFFNG
nr:MAG TPA: hypothetical protein [Caudoviricetes sp.]